jgi:hypothetical protein
VPLALDLVPVMGPSFPFEILKEIFVLKMELFPRNNIILALLSDKCIISVA